MTPREEGAPIQVGADGRREPTFRPSTESNHRTDEELVLRSREGDGEAFGGLVSRHQPAVTGFLMGMLGNLDDAEDAAQEAFVKAFRSLPSFQGRSSFRTWVTRIAINTARSRQRWSFLRRALSLDASRGEDEAWEESFKATAAEPEREALDRRLEFDRAVKSLAPREREVVALRMEGYALAEIADIAGISEGTVKSTLFSAPRKMRRDLS
ncbi:MAG: sigma-70 family RNA polymerase sigma factor [Elusimicrobiota bacterium]